AATQPETVTAVVGLVAEVSVARTPGLDAIVVGVGSVVLHKEVSARHPAVEHANENAVSTLGDVVAEPIVVIRAALDEHAGRIPRMHLAGRAVDANAIGKIVSQKTIARRAPELRARIRAAGEIVVLDQILVRLDQVQTVPDTVCFGVPHHALADAFEQQPATRRQLAPAVFGIVIIVREVAALDEHGAGVAREQSSGKTPR